MASHYVTTESGRIDRGIASLIVNLNEAGYTTHTSCSGIKADHPRGPRNLEGYISFSKDLSVEQQEKIMVAAKKAKMQVSQATGILAIYTPKTEEPEQVWAKFEQALLLLVASKKKSKLERWQRYQR